MKKRMEKLYGWDANPVWFLMVREECFVSNLRFGCWWPTPPGGLPPVTATHSAPRSALPRLWQRDSPGYWRALHQTQKYKHPKKGLFFFFKKNWSIPVSQRVPVMGFIWVVQPPRETSEHLPAPKEAPVELERDFGQGYGVTGQRGMASNWD